MKAHIEKKGLQFTEVDISTLRDQRMHFSDYENTSKLCKAINDKYIAKIDQDRMAQNTAATAAAAEVTTDASVIGTSDDPNAGGAGRSRRRRNIKKKKTKSRHR